ncbi:MAG: phage terminase large subunit [Sediminibacterium sp.]|uniref:phage terminase large subunit n=1 Tax=Sediminibacterium sp. TaxID=1917865 RepID=UPI00271F3963|nr:phage terminase large subunit [Sediminibacterium sp.]MDO8997213.1 phage terminase large subunit [Sediminibacterium sp.]
METKKKIKFNFTPEKFLPDFRFLLFINVAIQLLTGNRGSGKSVFFYQKAIVFALTKRYFRLVYSRKVADTLRGSTFQGFKDVIAEWKLEKYFTVYEGSMRIVCKVNGNILMPYGLDKPEKLKGIKDPTHVFVDEMTEISFADFAHLQGVLRTSKIKQTEFWGAFNPEYDFWGRNHFFLDNENDEIPFGSVPTKTENTIIFKGDFRRNPYIDPIAYEAKLRELAAGNENYLTVWIDGNWGQPDTGNEFYTNFKKVYHIATKPLPYLNGKALHTTFDFNVHPYMTALAAQVNITDSEFQIRILREYCLPDPFNTTEACCNKISEDYGDRIVDLFYYGDASGKNGIAGKGNKSAFDDVVFGFKKYLNEDSRRVMKSNPPLMKRRDFINRLLAGKVTWNGLEVTLIIDPSCKELIKDLVKIKVGPDGKLKKKFTDKKTGISYELLGHTSDALDYLIIRLLYEEFKKQND